MGVGYCWGIGVWFTCVTDREGGCGLLLGYRCAVLLCVMDREGGVDYCWGIGVWFTCVLWTKKVGWIMFGYTCVFGFICML